MKVANVGMHVKRAMRRIKGRHIFGVPPLSLSPCEDVAHLW
jgi:hypothetical protein